MLRPSPPPRRASRFGQSALLSLNGRLWRPRPALTSSRLCSFLTATPSILQERHHRTRSRMGHRYRHPTSVPPTDRQTAVGLTYVRSIYHTGVRGPRKGAGWEMGMASNPGPWANGASTADASGRVRQRTWHPTMVKHRDKTATSVAATAQSMCLWRLGQPEAQRQSPCKYASVGGNTGWRDVAAFFSRAVRTLRCR